MTFHEHVQTIARRTGEADLAPLLLESIGPSLEYRGILLSSDIESVSDEQLLLIEQEMWTDYTYRHPERFRPRSGRKSETPAPAQA